MPNNNVKNNNVTDAGKGYMNLVTPKSEPGASVTRYNRSNGQINYAPGLEFYKKYSSAAANSDKTAHKDASDRAFSGFSDSYRTGANRAIDNSEKKAMLQYDNQKNQVNDEYNALARQGYINYMDSKKNMPQQLKAQGMTGGLSESSQIALSNSYGQQMSDNQRARLNALSDIDMARTGAMLDADNQRVAVESDIATKDYERRLADIGYDRQDSQLDKQLQHQLLLQDDSQKHDSDVIDKNNAFTTTRDATLHGYDKENMATQQGYTQDNMRLDQQFTQDNMATQQGYTQDNMRLDQQFTQDNMDKQFDYDMQKIQENNSFTAGQNDMDRNLEVALALANNGDYSMLSKLTGKSVDELKKILPTTTSVNRPGGGSGGGSGGGGSSSVVSSMDIY